MLRYFTQLSTGHKSEMMMVENKVDMDKYRDMERDCIQVTSFEPLN